MPTPMLADYASLIDPGMVFVFDHGRVRALIFLEPRADCLFVENVAVDPAYQGQGLGRRMLQFAETEARRCGLSELWLYTNEAMLENLDFYSRLGFEIVDHRTEGPYRRIYFRKCVVSSPAPLL
jgi:ribosomal protein S18 acetylase RimI-like enzyme